MRILSILFCLVLIGCTAADITDNDSAPIMAQEEVWVEALLVSDMEAVDALMHPNFRLVRAYSDAPPIDKSAYLGMAGMSANTIKITSTNIDVSGTVAVAQISMTLDWQQEGVGKLPPHFELTDIWVQGADNNWRILSRVSQTVNVEKTAH